MTTKTPKIVTQFFWVAGYAESDEGLSGYRVGEAAESARPEGARLVSLTPAGSAFSPGTFLAVWEVES
jgi:hypothetical protein